VAASMTLRVASSMKRRRRSGGRTRRRLAGSRTPRSHGGGFGGKSTTAALPAWPAHGPHVPLDRPVADADVELEQLSADPLGGPEYSSTSWTREVLSGPAYRPRRVRLERACVQRPSRRRDDSPCTAKSPWRRYPCHRRPCRPPSARRSSTS